MFITPLQLMAMTMSPKIAGEQLVTGGARPGKRRLIHRVAVETEWFTARNQETGAVQWVADIRLLQAEVENANGAVVDI